MPDSAVLTDPIELHAAAEIPNDHQIAGECSKQSDVDSNQNNRNCIFCLDTVKTIIALLLLYSFYFGFYFCCVYFSMTLGHHSYVGYVIFFFTFMIILITMAYIQLCREKEQIQSQQQQHQQSGFVVQ